MDSLTAWPVRLILTLISPLSGLYGLGIITVSLISKLPEITVVGVAIVAAGTGVTVKLAVAVPETVGCAELVDVTVGVAVRVKPGETVLVEV